MSANSTGILHFFSVGYILKENELTANSVGDHPRYRQLRNTSLRSTELLASGKWPASLERINDRVCPVLF
jgi:hypothetical protein